MKTASRGPDHGAPSRSARVRADRGRRSGVLPDLDFDELTRIVAATDESHQTEAVRAYRKALHTRG